MLAVGPAGFCPLGCPGVEELRLQRLMTDVLASLTLSTSALLLQVAFSNDLMDPYLTGALSGAMAFMAASVLAFGLTTLVSPQTYVAAFFGAFAPGALVALYSLRSGTEGALVLGIALTLMLQGLASLLSYLAATASGLPLLPMLLGTTAYSAPEGVKVGLVTALILVAAASVVLKDLYLLEMGEEVAVSYKVNARLKLAAAIALASALSSLSVVVCGVLPFLGLIGANVGRKLGKYGTLQTLVYSFAFSLFVMTISDVVANSVETPYGYLPVGALLSLLGGSVFALAVLRGRAIA